MAVPVVYDNRKKENEPFAWSTAVLNLPGLRYYASSKPRVYKKRRDEKIAGYIIWFVDDGRDARPTEQVCWEILQQAGKVMSYLGVQVMSREIRRWGWDKTRR